MNRGILKYTAITMIVFGLIAVGYVFLSSLNPAERAKAESEQFIDITDLNPGELKVVKVYEMPLFIHRVTKQEQDDLHRLDAHVWNPEYSGYDKKQNVFAHWGISTKSICGLVHLPKGKSRLDTEGAVWLGGYFDPCRDSSYDYAGRAIKTHLYSGNGYTAEVSNLRAPVFEVYATQMLIHGY